MHATPSSREPVPAASMQGGNPGGWGGGPPQGGPPGGWGGPPQGGPPGGGGGWGAPPAQGPGHGAPQQGAPQAPVPPPPDSSSGGLGGKIAGGVFGGLFAIAVGGAVIAQNFLGIEIPIVGKFLGGQTSGSGKGSSKLDPEQEFKQFGVAMRSADPDELVKNAGGRALAWAKDAKLYSINVLGFKADGLVDFTQGGSVATIEYFSPSAVGSTNTIARNSAIKKYIFNSAGVTEQTWGVKERVENVPGTPVPKCTSKQLAKIFAGKGLSGTKTVHLNLDPGFAFATDSLTYHAMADDPKINVWLDLETCAIKKELK